MSMNDDDKLTYLFSLKGESILSTDMFNLFSQKTVKNANGTTSLEAAMFLPTQKITVKKGQLSNIDSDIETTVGRYIFNLVAIDYAFQDKIPFINYTLKSSQIDSLNDKLCDMLLMNQITGEQFGTYQTRIVWFNNFTELFVPGTSINLLVLPQEIKDELQHLIMANKKSIIDGDAVAYHNNVEVPILKFAKNWYITNKEPGWLLYAKGGKPKFDNVFKNMYLTVGPILDIATGKYVISTRCFNDGIAPDETNIYANNSINGAYHKGVATQDGGAKTKSFSAAFQSLVVTEEDCGTNLGIEVKVTKDNLNSLKWRWVKDVTSYTVSGKSTNGDANLVPEERWQLITPDNISTFIGKTIIFRTPMFCKSANFCWKCVGDLYRRLGIKNVGLTAMKMTSTFLNSALKANHDSSIKTAYVDYTKDFYEFK